MILSDVSIKRPVFATMLNLVLVVFGLFALPRLAIDQYPNVDFPVITATVVYPGADPETVEQRILEPLEEAVNGISGLKTLSSNAFPNVAQIILQFNLEKDSNQASQEVRDKIFAKLSELPNEAETPVIQKFDIGGAPIVNIAVTNPSLPYGQLSDLSKDVIQPALERVNGVAAINAAGIREREIHILVDRDRLASFGLTPQDLVQAVQSQSVDVPAGQLKNERNAWSLRLKGRSANAEEIANLPLLNPNAQSLRLRDVATVSDTIADEETAAMVGFTPTILLSVQKQSGANTPQVAADSAKALAQLQSQLPKGTNVQIVSDNSKYIKGSIDAVKLDLVLGAFLATFIVMVFLRDFWITVISAIALPVSVIATFAFLQAMGFTLNTMTTLGLSLSIGILIDDAIIVIENIHRHLSMGKTGAQAAKDATSEIGLAVFATTLTICAVFVPVAFMEGILGRFFYSFGLTVAFAVLVSLFCAFTIAPMLSARLLTPGEHEPRQTTLKKIYHGLEHAFVWMDDTYRSILRWCLAHRALTVAGGFGVFLLGIVMFLFFVPKTFFPKEDRSQIIVNYTLPEGTSLDGNRTRTLELVSVLQTYPGVDKVVSALAASGDRKVNKSRIEVLLIEKGKRSFSQQQLMAKMRSELVPLYAVGGAELTVSEQSGGGGGRSEPIQYVFKSNDWNKLITYTEEVAQFMKTSVPGAVDVGTTKPKPSEEYRILIDQGRAADLKVTAGQIGTVLRSLFEGDKIGDIVAEGKTIDVRLRIADKDRLSPEVLNSITLRNNAGQVVTLGSIATVSLAKAPSAIERRDRQRQITVVANFTGKDLGGTTALIDAHLSKTMPPEITVALAGQAELFRDAIAAIGKALLIAVLLVYMVLCAQYESYLAPLVIMAALPLSLTGAFGALLITGQSMSIYGMIGIILLMGLVTKNGILLIDFTLQRIKEGLSVYEALMEAGPIRLRPILMTTFAAGGGMLPIAIGHGEGGEARAPMGVAVIGGLLMSTFLTLVVVPCLFSLAEQAREALQRRKAAAAGAGESPAAGAAFADRLRRSLRRPRS
jgi:HAE1 family hydrophobic/amphiphilic exporter-1